MRQRDRTLAENVERAGQPIRLRLSADGSWRAIGSDQVASIYDSETRMRWENHRRRYVPVVGSYGSQWKPVAGRYVLLGH